MICNNIIDDSHIFDGHKSYIVDTNVLLSLYGHTKFVNQSLNNTRIQKAQQHLNKAIDSNADVFVPAIVVSEFINCCLREAFKDYKSKIPKGTKVDYKRDYRNSNDYKKDLDYYINVLKNDIFSKLKYINDSFDSVNIDNFFKFNNDDFNDKLLIHIANTNNFFVISADNDISTLIIS